MIAVFADAAARACARSPSGSTGAPAALRLRPAKTPCAAVVGREFRFVGRACSTNSAGDDLPGARLDSYAAYPLNDAAGTPLGLIAAMDRGACATARWPRRCSRSSPRARRPSSSARAPRRRCGSEASYRAIFNAGEDSIFVHDWDTGASSTSTRRRPGLRLLARGGAAADVADMSANEPAYTPRGHAAHPEGEGARRPVRFEWPRGAGTAACCGTR